MLYFLPGVVGQLCWLWWQLLRTKFSINEERSIRITGGEGSARGGLTKGSQFNWWTPNISHHLGKIPFTRLMHQQFRCNCQNWQNHTRNSARSKSSLSSKLSLLCSTDPTNNSDDQTLPTTLIQCRDLYIFPPWSTQISRRDFTTISLQQNSWAAAVTPVPILPLAIPTSFQ